MKSGEEGENIDWIKSFRLLGSIAIFFVSIVFYGQGEGANWYFGNNAGINFETDSVTALIDGELKTNEGCATISNSKGELLFYTDGITVWDKNHNIMPNGQGLLGNPSSTQSAIIVPKPNSETIYYIFTVINGGRAEGLRYSEVDLTLNSGNGDVNSNKNVLLLTPCSEKISAVKHANGTDYWVATHGWNNSDFALFKITENGLELTPVISSVGSYHGTPSFNSIGYMKFSPNGKKLAIARWSTNSLVEVLDFDSNTGVLSNPMTLDSIFGSEYENGAYGIEFSPNSKLLYVSEIDLISYSSKLHQFNLSLNNKTDIVNSRVILYRGGNLISAIQLALDGKIYLCRTFVSYLDAIENPNVIGTSSNYLARAIDLNGKGNVYGLPTFIQSLFVAKIEVNNLCSNDIQFNLNTEESINTVTWDFGDGEFSSINAPNHTYNAPGEYTVKAKIDTGFNIININKSIVVFESPIANKAKDYVVCNNVVNDNFKSFDLLNKTSEILGGQLSTDFDVSYFESFDDATNNIGALAINYTNNKDDQEIYARIQNRLNNDCYDISSFLLVVETKIAGLVDDLIVCDDQSNDGKEIIDLSQFDIQVSSNQPVKPQTDNQITYHLTEAEANLGTASLPKIYETESNNQDIYARFENTISGCFDITQFKIIIDNALTAHQPSDMYLCDDQSNDGKEVFDLASQKLDILKSQTGKVTFHVSQSDADSGNNPLNESFENQSRSQEIFVRVENSVNASCYDTMSFNVEVIAQPIAGHVDDYTVCDDQSNDGKAIIDLSQFNAAVFNGQSTTNYSVTYHETQSDVESGDHALPENYDSGSQEIFARLENTATSLANQSIVCYSTTKFNIIIDKALTAHQPSDMYLCDDPSNDGKEVFDLASQKSDILKSQTGKVTFHVSQSDADSGNNPLNESFENQSRSQEIFVRVENSVNASCYDTMSFNVEVIAQPIAGHVDDYTVCDDQSNDGKAIIDLSQFNAAVFNGQSTTNYSVTYHETQSAADIGTGALPDNYESSSQEIFTRIENKLSGSGGQIIICYDTTKFNVIIDNALTAHQPSDIHLCDDASNDGKELFDLASQKSDILKTQTGEVTFYTSQSDADSGDHALNENFENQLIQQEIFVRVENPVNTNCYDTTSFYVEVTSQATAGHVADYFICDDQSNDGKEIIDLRQFDTSVFNGQSSKNYSVTYHETQSDADIGTGALPDSYESYSQEIFARIENKLSSSRGQTIPCYNTTKFNIIIDKTLTAHQPSDMYLCDDASNDGKELFDLASQKSDILKLQIGKVTFHVSQYDADSGNNPLNENFENQSRSQEIFVRVENPVNATCYDTTSFYVEVTTEPVIDIIKTWYLCPGEDLQLYLNTIHDEYLWSNGKTDSEIIIDEAGSYSVTVYNINENGFTCSVTETIQVLETELPKSVDIIVTDWTYNNNSIQVNVDGTESYLFSIDGDLYQSSNTFNNVEAGDYIVYVKNEKGCLLYTEDVYLLNYPKFFTPNNDGYNDYWKINFSETEPDIAIHIFDRYGKLIVQLNSLSKGWDGTLNGQLLGSSDYWFVVNRPSKSKQYRGHFTLKR